MEKIEYWKFCQSLNAIQAALLIIGEDPSECEEYVLGWEPHNRPDGFNPVFTALKHDIEAGTLKANIIKGGEFISTYDPDGIKNGEDWAADSLPDYTKTTINVGDLKGWLRSRGVRECFFYTANESGEAPYLDPEHECYAPKLAAAVAAWTEVSKNPELLKNKTPKQAIEKFLRQSASKFSLTKDDGSPSEQGIGDIARVANWNTKGGATKTFSSSETPKNRTNEADGINLPTPSKNDSDIEEQESELPF